MFFCTDLANMRNEYEKSRLLPINNSCVASNGFSTKSYSDNYIVSIFSYPILATQNFEQ